MADTEWIETHSGLDEETAVLLLDAAQTLDYDASVVQTTSHGFRVPKDVADASGIDYEYIPEPEVAPQAEATDGELSFRTRAEAEEYAEENGIEIEGASEMKADEYKAAVVAASEEN